MRKIDSPGYNRTTFDAIYGEGKWREFVKLVKQNVRPREIRKEFVNGNLDKQMTSQIFYKWKARV
jgi:hypothetical protein